jgi:hypothetical protein
VKKHLVEDGPFRMSRTIDSCHSKDKDSGCSFPGERRSQGKN